MRGKTVTDGSEQKLRERQTEGGRRLYELNRLGQEEEEEEDREK